MERPIVIVVATAVLGFAASALAQQPADREAPPTLASQAPKLSESDLAKFADIYVDLERTVDKFEPQLAAAKTDEEAREVHSRMEQESTATVAQHGWTPERYLSVGDAINADQTLAEKTLKLIAERR
jgi:hypothetical protein